MKEFSLEKISENINYGKTKDYFNEVLSSYNNGNYRSAVVMLWSVAVCDIIYKLKFLVDLYSDNNAQNILDEINSLQENNPTSSGWEITLVDRIVEKTNLIGTSEYENLRYLQKQRHLSAHPTLDQHSELHSPNKETVRALLRNTLEDLLIKPPFYTKKILNELLKDISENTPALNNDRTLKQYVESKYLDRFTTDVALEIFKSLWKLVFKIENEHCDENRDINLRTLIVISTKYKSSLNDLINQENDFFSNVASNGTPLRYLVHYLAQNDNLYSLLNDDTHIKITHCIETTQTGKICGWFIKDNMQQHYLDLIAWIENEENLQIEKYQFEYMLTFSDTSEWQNSFCKVLSTYYGKSLSFNTADSRFNEAISPFLHLFDENAFIFLLNKIESNNQLHGRGAANHDHNKIKEKIISNIGTDFDFSVYTNFV